MKKQFKKIIIGTIAMASCTCAFASTTKAEPPQPNPFSAVASAINNLGTEIKAISIAAMHDFNNLMFQVDHFFPNGSNSSSSSEAQQTVSNYSNQITQQQVTNALSQIPEQAIPASQLDDQTLIQKIRTQKKLLGKLTAGTPASDTLYSNGINGLLAGSFGAKKPTKQYNNYFNFDSLITPDAYNQDELKAATTYLQYLTQNYKTTTPGVDFNGLKNKLSSFSNPIERAKWLKTHVIDNPTFQKYQLSIRSNIAARSLAMSNFNMLMAQRIPVKNLGTVDGLPQDPNLPKGYASLLQSQDYAATQLINNPNWYKSMKTASPATVDREQLLLLATLVREQHQNEIYNQRLLATMSLVALELNQAKQMTMTAQARKINQLWGGGNVLTSGESE